MAETAPRVEILDEDGTLYAEAEYWEGAEKPFILGLVKNPEGFLSPVEYADLSEDQASRLVAFITAHSAYTTQEATA